MPRPAARSRSEVFVFMVGASALLYFDRIAMPIAGPDIRRQFGLTETQLGLIFSAFQAAYGLGMLPAGALSDRLGPARVLGAAGLVCAMVTAATGLCGLGPTAGFLFPLLLAARALFGAASAPLYPACGALTGSWFTPALHGRVQGAVVAAGSLGASAAPFVISGLIRRWGWRPAFGVSAAVTALFFIAWRLRVRDPTAEPAAGRTDSAPWRALLANRAILLLMASYFFTCYLYGALDNWMYYYFLEVKRLGEEPSALGASLTQAVIVIAMPLGGWASDRLAARTRAGRAWVGGASLALGALLWSLGCWSTSAVTVAVLFSLGAALASAAEGSYWALAIQAGGHHLASAFGLVNAAGCIGMFLAPLVLPLVAARFGWNLAVATAGIAAAIAALGWVFLARVTAHTGHKQNI